jgi:hypothetical protein
MDEVQKPINLHEPWLAFQDTVQLLPLTSCLFSMDIAVLISRLKHRWQSRVSHNIPWICIFYILFAEFIVSWSCSFSISAVSADIRVM